MKNKIILSVLMISILFSIIAIASPKADAKEESNGYHVEEVIRDKFNKDTLDSNWRLEGASTEHYYNAMHCVSPVSYGSGPIINGARLSDNTRIEFTLYPQVVQGGANISFNIGMPSTGVQLMEPNVDCKIQLWPSQISFVVYQDDLVFSGATSKNLAPTAVNLYDATTTVAINVIRRTELLTEIYVEYYRGGKLVSSTEGNSFQLLSPRYPNGYCGFFWDCLEMDVTDFKVYNNGELVLDDNLETNSITFQSQDASLGNIHIIGLNETQCFFANVNSIKMDSANEAIINSYELKEVENVSNPFELTYTAKINELNENSFVGFGYGLSANDSNIGAKNAIGFIKQDESNAEVVIVRNGVIDRSNNYAINMSRLSLGKYLEYSVSFDYAKRAYLTVNGLTFKFENVEFVGGFGIGLIDFDSTKASCFELNEISLMENTYKGYDSCDITNDFSGTKPAIDDSSWDDPYINTQKYFVGPQATLVEDLKTGQSTIRFMNAGAYSAFGVRQRYAEFICEFDIDVFSRQNNQYIGLSFGRQSVVDALTQASISSKSFLFRCDNNGASAAHVLWGSGCVFSNGSDSQASDINIFDSENTKYHLMFVAKNRSLSVYYKAEDAPNSDLGILRAYIPNVNIDGYASVVGTNGASFQVSNFKMINLSDECTQESNATLRETFDNKNNVSNKLILDSQAKVKDGKLEMTIGSSVQTMMQYLHEIIRFTTYEVEDSLEIYFSQGKKLTIDSINNQIVVDEDGELTSYDCGSANLKNIKGKRFEITIIGNTLKVGYKGYYDPADKLSSELISHTFDSELSVDNVTLVAVGKVVIDDLYLFALDNSMKCDRTDYADDPDNVNIWEIKSDYDPSKVYEYVEEGCNSSIGVTFLVLPLLGVLAFALLRRKENCYE